MSAVWSRRLVLALAAVVVAIFAAADLSRATDRRPPTLLSMAAWTGFAILFLAWLCEGRGVRATAREVARVLLLGGIAFVVIYVYYAHSRLLEAGIEVDATYTFMGLDFFAAMANPITFAGYTVSFAQLPLALLGHLPGYLIGFDRLGPFAIHLAIMLQVALLLALLTTFVVERRLLVQAAVVAGVAAVFSNRLTLLLYNLTGYAIPSTAIGVAFLTVVLDRRPFAVTAPRVGGLLMLSLMHHYPGWFFVLPLVGLWVVGGGAPIARSVAFVRANVPLCAAVVAAIVCVTTHPELLLPRLLTVSVPTLTAVDLRDKLHANWGLFAGPFPSIFVRTFFRESPGSWHLLDIPPLGGWLPAIVVANWLVTIVAMGRRAPAYAGALVLLAASLVVLTVAQHLVTGFEDYRDMPLLIALTTAGVGFVLLAPGLRPVPRILVVCYAAAVAAYQYADVAALAGRRYLVDEYAPREQAITESLRRFWRSADGVRLEKAVVTVVLPARFPLEYLYKKAADRHGITIEFVTAETYCLNAAAAVEVKLRSTCETTALVLPAGSCDQERAALGWPVPTAAGTAMYLFASSCAGAAQRVSSAPEVIDLS